MSYINYYDSGFTLISHGSSFPNINGSTSSLQLTFNAPVTVSIDYGNGVTVDYVSKLLSGVYYVYPFYSATGSQPAHTYPVYVYPDGLNIDRRISINIQEQDKQKLTGIAMIGYTGMPNQFLTISFNNYPNLESLALSTLNSNILGLDPSFLTLPHFITYGISNNVANPSSSFYGVIPSVVLAKSTLTTLKVGDPGVRLKSFADSNLDKIATSYPVLSVLGISQYGIGDNHMGDGPLPSNLVDMTTLTRIQIHGSAWTTLPDIFNDIPNYTFLEVIYTNTIVDWGDLSTVAPRLTTLNFTGCNNLPMTLPTWFDNLTSLKSFSWQAIGIDGTSNINTFISNWYTLITSNAAITGANTLPFRGITLHIEGDTSLTHAVIPSGVYQQPSGYIQGSSNGTPTSSLERLWVLANQYGHTNNYRTV